MAINIEIFGVRGYTHDVLKSRLIEELDKSGVDYRIQDVQNIEDFISEGLESVPVIRVNHSKNFTKPDHTSVEEVVAAVRDYILQQGVQCVICPVDFSTHSINAAKWAYAVSKVLGMRLKLVHVHFPVSEAQYAIPVDMSALVKGLQSQLDQTADALREEGHEGMPILTELEIGDAMQQVVHYSKDPSTGLIVAGTLGQSSPARRLFGSVSSAIAQHAHVPVILVPGDVRFHGMKQIMVAFHQELLTNGALAKLTEFNTAWNAHLQFVHIRQDTEDYSKLRDRLLERLTAGANPSFSFDVREVNAESKPLLPALLEFANENNPDMIALVTRHRNIIRRLLHPGTTRILSLHTRWPLLVMHQS